MNASLVCPGTWQVPEENNGCIGYFRRFTGSQTAHMSAEARKRTSDAQKKRSAKRKKGSK